MTKVFFELRLLAQNIQSLLTVVRCLKKKKKKKTCQRVFIFKVTLTRLYNNS